MSNVRLAILQISIDIALISLCLGEPSSVIDYPIVIFVALRSAKLKLAKY